MNLSALFPPTLVSRLLDDIGAIADAARTLPRLERAIIDRLDALRRELAPVQELPAVRTAVESLPGRLDALYRELAPIQQVPRLREDLAALHETLAGVAARLETLDAVRAGIEPLDDDMRQVRESVDTLEPQIEQVNTQLEVLRADLAPLGELADKIPGIG